MHSTGGHQVLNLILCSFSSLPPDLTMSPVGIRFLLSNRHQVHSDMNISRSNAIDRLFLCLLKSNTRGALNAIFWRTLLQMERAIYRKGKEKENQEDLQDKANVNNECLSDFDSWNKTRKNFSSNCTSSSDTFSSFSSSSSCGSESSGYNSCNNLFGKH